MTEHKYIDKDYLVDYQKFYSRSFKDHERHTRRVHFFNLAFDLSELKQWLVTGETEQLAAAYLGFAVIKPVKDAFGNAILGRTILCPPIKSNRVFVTKKERVSLFGIRLQVEGLPFQVQDQAVSRCATVALWIVTQPLVGMFQTSSYSPAEITEISTAFPGEKRVFPNVGLTNMQIVGYLRSIGLDVDLIAKPSKELAAAAVQAYLRAGIPIMATLILSNGTEELYHAVVIAGYEFNSSGEVTKLFVHDDQTSPYSPITQRQESREVLWEGLWPGKGYKSKLEELFVPVYPKIRLDFYEAYSHYLFLTEEAPSTIHTIMFLSTVQDYKESLLRKSIDRKEEVLTAFLPRFLWIIRASQNGQTAIDFILDGTSTRPEMCLRVRYRPIKTVK